jgi:hypothetical protein
MPYGDGTGPLGHGPRTGRGAGFCGGYNSPGSMNNTVPRMGLGRRSFGGWGNYEGRRLYRRRSHCDPYYEDPYITPPTANVASLTKDEQKRILEEELKEVEKEKEGIEKSLKELQ